MQQGYVSIREILLDAIDDIPGYKNYFFSLFVQKPTGYVIKFNPAINDFVAEFAEKEPEYFDVVDEFINVDIAKYLKMKVFPPSLFLRLECLSVILPNLIDFLQKNSAGISVFKTSQAFLRHASLKKVPLDFYPHLAFVLLTDEMDYNIRRIKEDKKRARAEQEMNTIKTLCVKSSMILKMYSDMAKEKVSAYKIQTKPIHIFIKNGKPMYINLFDGNNARVFIMLGDRGTGKTIGLLRFIWSCYRQGNVVIIFGKDTRKEFRFASFKLMNSVDHSMWQTLHDSGEQAEGFPMTIYTDDPKYPNEYSLLDFLERPKWDNMKGIVLFESEEFDTRKEVMEYETTEGNIKERIKLRKEYRLTKIMESFIKWRSENRTKKIVVALNEAQNIVGSVIDAGTWHIAHSGEKLLTDIRGLSCPVVLNTQYMTRLKKSGQQFDVLFASYITNTEERKKIANIYGMRNLTTLLGVADVKDKKLFYMIARGNVSKIKFLPPPCMPENNKYQLEELYKKFS